MKRHIAALALLLALAGCGSASEDDGVASAGGTGSDPTTSTAAEDGADGEQQALEFAKCMRENGVPEFPDPDFSGDGGIGMHLPEGLDRATVEAAQEKCKQYQPNGGEPMEPDPERVAEMREYAQCMRENGVPDFPDPDAGGGIAIEGGPGLDPMSEEFKAAEAACGDMMPGGGGGKRDNREDGDK